MTKIAADSTKSALPESTPSDPAETHTSEPSLSGAFAPAKRPAIPSRDANRYEILGEHGRGGIGCVLRAHDRDLGREVAIKKLLSRGNLSELRFLREALITARLEHPGIVPVHEAGRWSDGTPFYAMKLVAGRPLRDLIAACSTVDDRIRLLHHVIAVADAIAYAHGKNIIHRDLKPSNVIVGDFGETIVIDWGLAKDLTANEESLVAGDSVRAADDDDLTSAGTILGTPAYMAPEQARGEAADKRADVFAIGALLWELGSLEKLPPAYTGQRRRILLRSGIDQDLIAIIEKATDPDPVRRYADAGALAADLKAFKTGARITARRYSSVAMLAHWIRHHRVLTASMVGFVVLVAVAGIALLRASIAERLADARITVAEVEEGRQALLHDDTAEARLHLGRAYQRGERSPGVAFMLARALQPRLAERASFPSAPGRTWSAVFSPDDRRVVAGDDTCARVWDVETRQLLFTLQHDGEVYDVQYSRDGATVVTAGERSVRIWDAASGALLRTLSPTPGSDNLVKYYHVALSPDGGLVAAIDIVGAIVHVWDTHTGRLLAERHGDGSVYPQIAFTADGRWLATSGGNDARVFDTTTWSQVMTLAGPHIRALGVDPTGPRVATGTVDGDVAIWAIPSGEQTRHLRELGDPVDAVVFSPDGAMVATATRDGSVQVWDASSGKLVSNDSFLRSKVFSLEFDASSSRVVAAGASGKVLVTDAALGMPLALLEGPAKAVRWAHFDRRGRHVVGASLDGTVRIWDAASTYLRWRSARASEECYIIDKLEPDRRFVAVGCGGHPVRVWDTMNDRLLAELPGPSRAEVEVSWALPAVSATGDRAAVARGNTVRLYAIPGGALLRTIEHRAVVNAVRFATTGDDLVSGTLDGSVLVTHQGRDSTMLPAFAAPVDAVGFLADGRPVAVAGGRLRIYHADRATLDAELDAPSRVMTLRASADGRRLLATSSVLASAPPMLWDVEQRRVIASLVGHAGSVWSAKFVRDDREILTSGEDGTVRLWDAATGKLIRSYRATVRAVSDATLDPGGLMIVTTDTDGMIRFLDAATERPLWTLFAHHPYPIALHFEGSDLITRGFGGDVAHWTLPKPMDILAAANSTTAHEADRD